ncbi:MAG: protein kinase [Planctomycetota bacterium]
MELSDLSATQLARIDAICLDFESSIRRGETPSIDEIVAKRGGDQSALLRKELQAVLSEFDHSNSTHVPFSIQDTTVDKTDSVDKPSPSVSTPPEVIDPGATIVSPLPLRAELERYANEDSSLPSATRGRVSRTGSTDGENPEPPVASGSVVPLPTSRLPPPGSMIGPYRLGHLIARGGMGAVFQAVDTRLDRVIAIKLLAVTGSKQRELSERFEREAKAVAVLTHPQIVELFDVGVHEGLPYAVMEFLVGETLADRVDRKPLSVLEVRALGIQVAEALAFAHSYGVVHRDLKPQNVMLISEGQSDATVPRAAVVASPTELDPQGERPLRAKLFDFGLSRVPRSDHDALAGGEDDETTRVGMILGTPGYMAPEQARGEPATAAADVFSLGCLMFESFYGRRAFDGPTPAARFASVLEHQPKGDKQRRMDDPDIADLIDQCLQKEISRRPTAAELASELSSRTVGVAGATNADRVTVDRRRFVETALGGAAGMLLGSWLIPPKLIAGEVNSIAVLSFTDADAGNVNTTEVSRPANKRVYQRGWLRGDQLAGLLVTELSRSGSLMVAPYHPWVIKDPEDYQTLGKKLNVDALINGEYRMVQTGSTPKLQVDYRIVSTQTGKLLLRDSYVTDSPGDALQQRRLAEQIASNIGCRLSDDCGVSDGHAMAYECMLKGNTYSEYDSKLSMQEALKCYKHASGEDPDSTQAKASIALSAMALASKSDPDEAPGYLLQAENTLRQIGDQIESSVCAQIANAMYLWQIDGDDESALQILLDLRERASHRWEVHHQLGLVSLKLQNRDPQAIESIRKASELYSGSIMLRADVARAEWYAGSVQRALGTIDQIESDWGRTKITRGLLIDIHEERHDFEQASRIQDGEMIAGDAGYSEAEYFANRQRTIAEIPYVAFGSQLNQTILKLRTFRSVDTSDTTASFDRLDPKVAPMLSLLLARHPAFARLRSTELAERLLSA